MICQSLEHFVDEGKGEMVLPGGLVKFSIVDAHPPAGDGSLGNEFIFLILNDCHSSFLGNHLNRAYPFTIRNGIDDSGMEQF